MCSGSNNNIHQRQPRTVPLVRREGVKIGRNLSALRGRKYEQQVRDSNSKLSSGPGEHSVPKGRVVEREHGGDQLGLARSFNGTSTASIGLSGPAIGDLSFGDGEILAFELRRPKTRLAIALIIRQGGQAIFLQLLAPLIVDGSCLGFFPKTLFIGP